MSDANGKQRKLGVATIPVVFLMISLCFFASFAAVSLLHGSSGLQILRPVQGQTALTNYWYVGAASSDRVYLQNNGVRSEIQVVQQNVSAFLGFWVSETMSNNLWGQVGYYFFQNSQPEAFYQVWNLTTRSEIAHGTVSVSFGNHLFSMYLSKGTSFEFSVDSSEIGYYDMKTNISSQTVPIYALSEEGYCSAPFSFEPVTFSSIQTLESGHWIAVNSAQSYGNAWGLYGNEQSQTIGSNEFIVGGNYASLNPETVLW